jgi:FkbM family methyltransferase
MVAIVWLATFGAYSKSSHEPSGCAELSRTINSCQLMHLKRIHTLLFRMRFLGIESAVQFSFRDLLARRHIGPEAISTIRSRDLEHPVMLRTGTSDIFVFEQILEHQAYAPALGLASVRTIVDLGANTGLVSAYFLSHYPTAHVLAVEPDPANFSLCQINLAQYGTRAETVNAAVWSCNGQVQVKRLGEYYSSQTKPADDSSEIVVPAYDMQTLLATHNIEAIDLLKIDIEGAETELFKPPTAWLDTVKSIVIELHGEQCRRAFFDALTGYRYDIASSGERTICKNLRKA